MQEFRGKRTMGHAFRRCSSKPKFGKKKPKSKKSELAKKNCSFLDYISKKAIKFF